MNQEQRLNKIRSYLLQQKKGTWTEISNTTKITQPKELSGDLKNLLDRKEIQCEQDTKDRRKTWYSLANKERSNAEIKRYETTEFILSLKNPIYHEESIYFPSPNTIKVIGKVGIFAEQEKETIETMKTLKKLETTVKLSDLFSPLIEFIPISHKLALTVTLERK